MVAEFSYSNKVYNSLLFLGNLLQMPSSHQLSLASQLARLRPTVMPGMAQDISNPGASLAAAAAAASLGLPFSLSHHHGLSLSNLGLGLHGMLPTPERQGVMAGFGMTTPQPQVRPTQHFVLTKVLFSFSFLFAPCTVDQ